MDERAWQPVPAVTGRLPVIRTKRVPSRRSTVTVSARLVPVTWMTPSDAVVAAIVSAAVAGAAPPSIRHVAPARMIDRAETIVSAGRRSAPMR